MSQMVVEIIADRARNAGVFAIMADETTDRQHAEDLAIGVRFVHKGIPEERVVAMVKLEERDAETLAALILAELDRLHIPRMFLVSQTHDGASVMSSIRGGVQAIISREVGRNVLYLHCLAHQLHLVVVWLLKMVPEVQNFFTIMQRLTAFFNKKEARDAYAGDRLTRLLPQRWTGHRDVVACFLTNQGEILDTLNVLTKSKDISISAEASIIHLMLSKDVFDQVAGLLQSIFEILSPLNLLLQQEDVDVEQSITMVQECTRKLGELIPQTSEVAPPTTKKIKLKIGVDRVIEKEVSLESPQEKEKRIRNIVEPVISEMKARFSEQNLSAISCLRYLKPGPHFLDEEKLGPLVKIATQFVKATDVQWSHQMKIGKDAWETWNNKEKEKKEITVADIADFFLNTQGFSAAFPTVRLLYVIALTFGSSSATVERGFSTLTRVLSPTRVSMTHWRKSNLVLLAANHDITSSLDMEALLNRFALTSRRLILY